MKKVMVILVMFLLVSSTLVVATDVQESPGVGFWGTIGCFIWGDSSARAGMSWFDRGALV